MDCYLKQFLNYRQAITIVIVIVSPISWNVLPITMQTYGDLTIGNGDVMG
jgi:hypothetical protein